MLFRCRRELERQQLDSDRDGGRVVNPESDLRGGVPEVISSLHASGDEGGRKRERERERDRDRGRDRDRDRDRAAERDAPAQARQDESWEPSRLALHMPA